MIKKMKEISRPKSLTETVTDNLRKCIVDGELSLGEHLSEASLANALGVSKTPVREALFILKKEGLIDIIPQKGSFVFKPDKNTVADLCNYRSFIEPIAIEESMKYAPNLFLEDLEACIIKMEKKYRDGDYKQFLVLDAEFHNIFFKHCNNQFLQQSYIRISSFIGALRNHLSQDNVRLDTISAEHRQILEHLKNNRIKESKETLFNHVIDIKEIYKSVVN
jgi:DNA-binding GntR family transcriptional regulator